jgi:D-3-phosphoglycerate dehydrogenase / 2-oxoglutarate reductase
MKGIIIERDRYPEQEMPLLAITIRSFNTQGPAYKKLQEFFEVGYLNTKGRRLDEDELCHVLETADVAISGTEPYTRKILSGAKRLKIISRVGVGLDSIDLDTATARGIRVLNTPDSTVQPVAEHTIALIFSILKNIPGYNERIRKKDFSLREGALLSGKNVGIIGLGRIGHRVAGMLEALGCRIGFYDPYIKSGDCDDWKKYHSLEDLFAGSDIITIHSTPQKDTGPLVDERLLQLVKKRAILINTARGSLIDEHALISALENGRLAGAGLDVFSSEPYNGPLLSRPQVIMTPHVASNTLESREQMEMEAVENCIKAWEEMKR